MAGRFRTMLRAENYPIFACICLALWPLAPGGLFVIAMTFLDVDPEWYRSSFWYPVALFLNLVLWLAPLFALFGSFMALRMRIAKRTLSVITAISSTLILTVQIGWLFLFVP